MSREKEKFQTTIIARWQKLCGNDKKNQILYSKIWRINKNQYKVCANVSMNKSIFIKSFFIKFIIPYVNIYKFKSLMDFYEIHSYIQSWIQLFHLALVEPCHLTRVVNVKPNKTNNNVTIYINLVKPIMWNLIELWNRLTSIRNFLRRNLKTRSLCIG